MQATTETTSDADRACALTHKTIGGIRGRFFVPDYQRGYRWDKNDVTRLLDDIWGSEGQDYSLQPIVVKLHQSGQSESDHQWELIDGQQRLTTLYLILQYMQQQKWKKTGAPYSLHYKTRTGSQSYLDQLDRASHNTNIDYWHLYRAHRRIAAWIRSHGDAYAQENVVSTLHGYLYKSVRVIWYEAPANTDTTDLFTRLNVGRIPLTDAELVKATLLSQVRSHSTNRAHEVAAQWGGIERDFHHSDIWVFVSGLAANESDEKYPTRISLLLDTLADEKVRPHGKRPRYHTFDILREEIETDYVSFWKKVMTLHAQIMGWAEHPQFYNKIGFLVANGDVFGELSLAAKGKKKSEFESFLVNRIRKRLEVKDVELEKLHYEDKKRGYPKLLQLLLLLNVETTSHSGLRFPFSRHVGQKWSLEHIHAQNAETLNKAEQWKIWLATHNSALDALVTDLDPNEITELKSSVNAAIADINKGKSSTFTGDKFTEISARVLKMLNRDDVPDHLIRNMALLSSNDNSRLSNSVFEVKRQMILELDRKGAYVPVCTRNVFLKYYAEAVAQQPHFWSDTDKDSYLNEIRSKLEPYLIDFGQTEEPLK